MIGQFDSTVRAVIKFLQLLNIKVNDVTVNNDLQNHPDWPSLLCVADAFSKWKIPNAAGTVNPDEIDILPTPFLAYTDNENTPLVVVSEISDTEVVLIIGNNKKIENKISFVNRWGGIYLIAEPNSDSGEVEYVHNRKKTLFNKATVAMTVTLVVILLLLLFSRAIEASPSIKEYSLFGVYFQIFLLTIGLSITILLVWYEIDQNNSILKKVCSGLIKSNCNAVLSSNQSKIFSWLSWSEFGLFFFTGNLLALLFADTSINHTFAIVSWLNLFALPYTIFSLYYQKNVAKNWCVLCLAVQAVLILSGINVIVNGFYNGIYLTFSLVINILVLFLIPFLIWFSIKPYLLQMQRVKEVKRQYLRLKFNTEVFNVLLRKQKKIKFHSNAVSIDLGNPQARNTIVKVCNPYCGPCSKAHPEIEKLLKSNDNLNVKIIFNPSAQDLDPVNKPIRHLLAIAAEYKGAQLNNALDDWYLPKDKDYNHFASLYPVSESLEKQNDRMKSMRNWCIENKITHTPTIFINGFELPNFYDIEDIQYFLSELKDLQ